MNGGAVRITVPGSSAEGAWHKHTKQLSASRESDWVESAGTPSVTLQPEVYARHGRELMG